MRTYLVVRRRAWRTIDDLREAAKRAESALERTPDDVRWIRSYHLAESEGSWGTVCVYRATSPEALRAHARLARLPLDEIVALFETVVVEPDPVETAA
ncbi:MAG TPA: nickel-binding protein [Gaiellaceae bacterium]|nr:nickel-binding protein [Gaiellaceae bacterium]